MDNWIEMQVSPIVPTGTDKRWAFQLDLSLDASGNSKWILIPDGIRLIGVTLEVFNNARAKVQATTDTIENIKSNGEIAGVTLDWNPYLATNPAQGQNGFTARLTFSGQEKLGVVQRLAVGEDLELVVQDDLTDLELLEVVAEGSLVREIS